MTDKKAAGRMIVWCWLQML